MEPYNRRELALRFELNENYMVQLFKKEKGVSISRYLNGRRIEEARKLLLSDEVQVVDVAYHVGFENLTHFYRLFKQLTGMTPKEFRDQNRNEIPPKRLN